jgi:hypothetical protein
LDVVSFAFLGESYKAAMIISDFSGQTWLDTSNGGAAFSIHHYSGAF